MVLTSAEQDEMPSLGSVLKEAVALAESLELSVGRLEARIGGVLAPDSSVRENLDKRGPGDPSTSAYRQMVADHVVFLRMLLQQVDTITERVDV